MPLAQPTLRYKTYLLESLVESLRPVFEDHPDELLKRTKVTTELPMTTNDYPAIVIRFNERSVEQAGVAHKEVFLKEDGELEYRRHVFYKGDIQFVVYALSSLDRAVVMDALLQIIMMADLEVYTNQYLSRIYNPGVEDDPAASEHWITINSDTVRPLGNNEMKTAWGSEDLLAYSDGYTTNVFGEVYSRLTGNNLGVVEEVTIYPWIDYLEPVPQGDPLWDTPWSNTMQDSTLTQELEAYADDPLHNP